MTKLTLALISAVAAGASYVAITGTPHHKTYRVAPATTVVTQVTPAAGAWAPAADTVTYEEEGVYIVSYDSARVGWGRPDPKTLYELVYDLGDTALAVRGDSTSRHGTVTISRKYFSDVSEDCDWVTDKYVARYRGGKAHGTWRYTETYCGHIWINDSCTYEDGYRISGRRLSTPLEGEE
jgi:hypothetical protein